MFRKLRQWVAGSEVAAMGRDLDVVADACAALAHKVEGLQLRLERLGNRVNMRLNRMAPGDRERDEEILRELRAGANGGGGFEDGWPQ